MIIRPIIDLRRGIMGFIKLKNNEIKRLYDLSKYGYVFDWTRKSSDISETIAFHHNGDLAGLVEFERRPASKLNYMWLVEVADAYIRKRNFWKTTRLRR